MNRPMMRLAWKEYRQLRLVWGVLLILGALLTGIGAVGSGVAWGQDAALIVAGLFALAGGALVAAGEREAGTHVFLDMLPISPLRVLIAKVCIIVVGCVTLAFALLGFASFVPWLVVRLFENVAAIPAAKPLGTAFAAWGPWAFSVFAWTLLVSTYRKRVAETALIGGACAAVSDYYLSSLFAPYPAVDLFYSVENMAERWWLRLVVALVVAAAAVYRIVAVPSIWTVEPSTRSKKQPCHGVGRSWWGVDQIMALPMRFLPRSLFPLGSPERALVWQQCRLSWRTYLAALTVPIVLAGLSVWAGIHHDPNLVVRSNLPLVIFYALATATMLGVDVFRHDNAGDSARFLRERGVEGRTVFWSRLLPNATVLTGVVLLSLGVLILFGDALLPRPDARIGMTVLGLSVVSAVIPFVAGMLFAQWLRSPLLAVTAGVLAGVIMTSFAWVIWEAAAARQESALWLYAYPVIVAAAMMLEAWMYADAWLERRRLGRFWRWAASPTLWALLLVPIAGIQYEITKWPPCSLNGSRRQRPSDVDWNAVWADELYRSESSADTEEAFETYLAYVETVRAIVPRETFVRQLTEEGIRRPEQTPGNDDAPEYRRQAEAYQKELDRRWLAGNREVVERLAALANRPYMDILPLVAEWVSRGTIEPTVGNRTLRLPDLSDEAAVAVFRARITWNDYDSRRLVKLVCLDADRLIERGELDEAWERILAAKKTAERIRTTCPRSVYPGGGEMVPVAATVDHWISAEGQTPSRLRKALATWTISAVPYRKMAAYRAFIAANMRYRRDAAKCVFGAADVSKPLDVVLRLTRVREWEDRIVGRLAERDLAMAEYLENWERGRRGVPPSEVMQLSRWEDRIRFSTVIYGDDFWSWPLEKDQWFSYVTERMTSLKLALAVYFAEYGTWPSRLQDLQGDILEEFPPPVYPYTEYHYYPHGLPPVPGKAVPESQKDVPCLSLGQPWVFAEGRFYALGTDGRWSEATSMRIEQAVFAVRPGCAAQAEPSAKESSDRSAPEE
ncbi:hypothetical protein JCM19992_10370 [Thermostilla marina]